MKNRERTRNASSRGERILSHVRAFASIALCEIPLTSNVSHYSRGARVSAEIDTVSVVSVRRERRKMCNSRSSFSLVIEICLIIFRETGKRKFHTLSVDLWRLRSLRIHCHSYLLCKMTRSYERNTESRAKRKVPSRSRNTKETRKGITQVCSRKQSR